ncbi:hypothetical protein R5R35_014025 [Gryllus longicercus]|uniref:Nuclear speckle splicing regulatory protein 1 N-terminal domain-containing protein n=1 Tax=Gryllus longicercus TaxID=2509291 RepID=A0AAN9WJ64_9ORTH
MASNSKQYGLILPQKANQGLVRDRPSVFNDSSESEDDTGATDWVRKALKRESEKTFQKKQNQVNIQKALEEDPTVYQYDEVYDTIVEKKAELLQAKKQQDKKPRYIQSLLQQAEKRKREHERRNERIIQKEREAEGDKFKDKESFVTSAYRQKLEEFKKLDEEEMRQDAIEALTDVSKQKDLSGFYRHLYRQTVSGEQECVPVKQDPDDPTEKSSEKPEPANEETVFKSETEKNDERNVSPSGNGVLDSVDNSDKKNNSRRYRRRRNSSASSKSDDSTKQRTTDNVDADSDFSVDSDSSESGSDESIKGEGQGYKKNEKKDVDKVESDATAENSSKGEKENSGNNQKKRSNEDLVDTTNKKIKVEKTVEKEEVNPEMKVLKQEKKPSVPKPNIWIKRTVGDVFESALQRYYQRKADKLASKG